MQEGHTLQARGFMGQRKFQPGGKEKKEWGGEEDVPVCHVLQAEEASVAAVVSHLVEHCSLLGKRGFRRKSGRGRVPAGPPGFPPELAAVEHL